MREIKFRGKFICTGEWVYGDLIHKRYDRGAVMIQDENGMGYDVDPESVGQYTGVKDANGKEIYDGDILTDVAGYSFRVPFNWVLNFAVGTNSRVTGNIHDKKE
jgi:uncharacterized phage protein (TIGR01671 family)